MPSDNKKRPVDPTTFIRTESGIFRRKTQFDASLFELLLEQTALDEPAERPAYEAIGWWTTMIHEMKMPNEFMDLLSDVRRFGLHPDRCVFFLTEGERIWLEQKAPYAKENANSVGGLSQGIGNFMETPRDKPKVVAHLSEAIVEEEGDIG